MTIKKKKNQKPIDIDAHFKYKCPQKKCGYDHWLSLKETRTLNFKVVCDCGSVFKPKPISKIQIIYKTTQKTQEIKETPKQSDLEIPTELLNDCVKLLVGYGFTINESNNLTKKAYIKHKATNRSLLVKYILQNLGELENGN